jgi:hypothetical protein
VELLTQFWHSYGRLGSLAEMTNLFSEKSAFRNVQHLREHICWQRRSRHPTVGSPKGSSQRLARSRADDDRKFDGPTKKLEAPEGLDSAPAQHPVAGKKLEESPNAIAEAKHLMTSEDAENKELFSEVTEWLQTLTSSIAVNDLSESVQR